MAPDVPRGLADELAARQEEFVGFVARRVSDRALAEDLVQTVFTRALERLETLRDDRAIAAWMYRSLRNAVVDHYRRRGAEERAFSSFARELEDRALALEAPPPKVCRCVLKVAESLKAEYVEALEAIEINDAAVKEFAAAAGISSGNAAVRVFRAREALRRGVLATCGACAADGCSDCTCGTNDAAATPGCHGASECH